MPGNISIDSAKPKYTSKTKRNECKNENCSKTRANGSSRCADCKKA